MNATASHRQPAQSRRRVPEGLRLSLPMLVLIRRMTDAQIAAEWGLEAWQVACSRSKLGLPNHAGWPCGDDELRRLVTDDALTDAEIGARFGIGAWTIRQRRVGLGLHRSHDPRPAARRAVIVIAETGRRVELTPIERALDRLGCRVATGRHGAYALDGRHVSVVDVLRAGGAV